MRYFIAVLLLVPTLLWAQSFPDYESTTVNDFAGLLTPDAEERLDAQLAQLRSETGVEMTVVTLSRQEIFAPDISFEAFATGLFDAWGIGDAARNDGVLVLVMHADRVMRIELGKAYGRSWDKAAARVIDDTMLPAFREDRYEAGIEAGVTDAIERIVTPYLAGQEAPQGGTSEGSPWTWLIVLIPGLGFLALIFKDRLVRLRKCPECGKRALNRTREVIRQATKTQTGDGEVTTRCTLCHYHHVAPYTISKRSSSSSSSFGGGRSGGGGASGKW